MYLKITKTLLSNREKHKGSQMSHVISSLGLNSSGDRALLKLEHPLNILKSYIYSNRRCALSTLSILNFGPSCVL